MCSPQITGGPSTDNSVQKQLLEEAKQARLRETERQAKIQTGMTTIDNTFAPYNDSFYGQRKSAFLDFYQPQLDDQFGEAKKTLTYALARNGTLNSTAAADQAAKLGKQYSLEQGALVNRATNDANSLKSSIEGERSNIKSQLNATGDASTAANDALARTKILSNQQPAYNPLGDIFAGVGDAVGNYGQAQQNRAIYNAYFGGKGIV